ncbi:MAG: TetR/AcrR family transcriptional regulator C-terminal domain-containing protein, partial [Actinomycetota bacterium]
YEFALDVFHRAGLRGADAVKAFHAFGGYILGFVTMELGLRIGGDDMGHDLAHEQMSHLAASGDLPRLAEALPHFIDCDDAEQFEFGLDLLIEGLRARAAATD